MSDDEIAKGSARLRSAFARPVRIALVLGSGQGDLVDAVEDPVVVPFTDVPLLPSVGVAGHGGRFVSGRLAGVDAVVQAGRIHPYEGHPRAIAVAPVRLLAGAGIDTLVLTNAAGGIRPGLDPGALVLLDDQIDLSFHAPLAGPARRGEARFPDMSAPFDPGLRAVLRVVAAEVGIELDEGTYMGVRGPSYETRAEVRMLARLGADVVGMSTVAEVTVARALGLRVVGLSLVTNRATGLSATPLEHDEVLEVGRAAAGRTRRLLLAALPRLSAARASSQSTGAK